MSGPLTEAIAALERGDAEAAENGFRLVLTSRPKDSRAWQGLGMALHDQQRFDEAEQAFRAAEPVDPVPALARYHVGLLHLLRGDMVAGWRGWEERLAVPSFGHPQIALPRWRGEPAPGKRLLVLAEQGFGDCIQFVRYLPWVVRRSGARVTFGCPPPLFELMRPFGSRHGLEVVTGKVSPGDFDLVASVCSLAGIEAAEATEAPYLRTAAEAMATWKRRRPARQLCVGLCWEGRASHPQDGLRSLDPALLLTLARLPDVILIGMQRPPLRRPAADALLQMDWGPDIADLAAAAAMLAALDVLVTVDTVLAHLAGALGVPALVLLPWVPDWRWGIEGEATAWYPSLRLLRQPSRGDWTGPIAVAAARLQARTLRS